MPERAPRGASLIRRRAPLIIAVLSALFIAPYVWWRIAAQYAGAEAFWTDPLAASADGFRSRAVAWLAARRDAAQLVASLLAPDGGRTPAFRSATAALLAGNNGVRYVTVRVGQSDSLAPPADSGRFLVPVVAPIGGRPERGVLTLWIDPEVALIPELLRAHGSMPGASTTIVRRDGDSAVVLHADSAAIPQARHRVHVADLPGLFAQVPMERELNRGGDVDGNDAIGVAAYVPLLQSHLYRSVPRRVAFAAFRAEVVTEALLAFLLGSFIFGLFFWSVRERREEQVRVALAQARFDSLQAQLRPHFLFNALNTIATLVHEDAEAANRMLVRLADLLRLSLEESEHAMITVERELALLDAFLDVERVRFGDALRVTTHIGAGVGDLLVPRWVLQPLVENAIKHGGAYSRGEATISLALVRHNDRLTIVVADDGPRVIGGASAEGVGLRNTRQRLDSIFGARASLVLHHPEKGGTEAVMEFPVREAK